MKIVAFIVLFLFISKFSQTTIAQTDTNSISMLFVSNNNDNDSLSSTIKWYHESKKVSSKRQINIIDASAIQIDKQINCQELIDALTNSKTKSEIIDFCIAKAMRMNYNGIVINENNNQYVIFCNDTSKYKLTSFVSLIGRMPNRKQRTYVPIKLYEKNLYYSRVSTPDDIKWLSKQAKPQNSLDSILTIRINEIKYAAKIKENIPEPEIINIDSISEQAVELLATQQYKLIKSMSDFSAAIFDCRSNQKEEVLSFFRRYYDKCELTHPSVLANEILPRYYIVVADDSASVSNGLNQIAENITDKRQATSIVLFAQTRNNINWAQVDTICDAVYMTIPIKKANDILTQAFFGGIQIGKSNFNNIRIHNLKAQESPKTRLAYSKPYMASMSDKKLSDIDDIMKDMISEKASPGGYVLVARNGRVVFSKAYGHTAYSEGTPINQYSLYDLASVSKVIGTLPIVMQMFDNNDISQWTKLGQCLELQDTAKQQITIANLLLHDSGLMASVPAFMLCVDSSLITRPVYSRTRKNGYNVQIEPKLYISDELKLKSDEFSTYADSLHTIQISQNLYTTKQQQGLVYKYMDNSPLRSKTYRYSDMNFIYLQRIAEKTHKKSLDVLFNQQIAQPLGICRMTYKPLSKYPSSQIVPTENDKYFRQQQLCGTVHDQTAALLGGVAGNAGLFGTANELAKISQMYLNGGIYGGIRLISNNVIKLFTSRKNDNSRRGYGFDKPEIREGKTSPVTDLASPYSFGHSGFSGTLIWIDPEYQLIYIFLSNRISPDAYNNKLTQLDIRMKIHTIIYESLLDVKLESKQNKK